MVKSKIIFLGLAVLIAINSNCAFCKERAVAQPSNPSQFNAERWKKNIKYDREKCVQDLLDSKLLNNKSRDAVLALLGKPDWDKKEYLGYEIRPNNADFKTLYINFKDGKVSTCELRENP